MSRADAVVPALVGDGRVEELEAGCVAAELADEEALLAGLEATAVGPDLEVTLDRVIRECAHRVTGTVNFVTSYAEDHPSATDPQLQCVAAGYSALSLDDIDAVIAASANPAAGESDVVDRVLRDCGL